MRLVALRVAYRGDGYHGFQRQPHVPTVEGDILSTLREAGCLGSPREAMYSAAGRTDKGAHALGQTISLVTGCEPQRIVASINESLYPRVAVWAYRVDPHAEFRAREWCIHRVYAYLLGDEPPSDVEERLRAFVGYRDYSWLVPVEPHRDPRRQVFHVGVRATTHGALVLVVGESFLKQQVRRMIAYAFGICPSKERCRPPPASSLVLLDTRYPFAFHRVPGARGILEELASGSPALEASLEALFHPSSSSL